MIEVFSLFNQNQALPESIYWREIKVLDQSGSLTSGAKGAAKGTGGTGQAAKIPNSTSALTDAEAGVSKLPKVWDVPDTTISKFPESWAVSLNKKGTGFRW